MNASQKPSQPWLENKVIISAFLILILNGTITFKLQEIKLHILFLLLNGSKVQITSPVYIMKKNFFGWKKDRGEFDRHLVYRFWHKQFIVQYKKNAYTKYFHS